MPRNLRRIRKKDFVIKLRRLAVESIYEYDWVYSWANANPIPYPKALIIKIPNDITPVVKYPKVVIPAKAGIQKSTGCRIKSGMTELAI